MLVFRSDLGPRCMSPKPKHGFSPRGGGGTSSNQSESEGFATTRLKRKVVVNQDGPSELGGGLGDLAEGLRLTVPPYAQRVLAVFILMQQDGLAAAHFLAAQNKLAVDSSILNTLRHLVEDAYLALSIAAILEVLNPSDICAAMVRVAHGRPFCGDIQIAHLGYAAKQERCGPKPATNSSCCQTLDSFRIAQRCYQQVASLLARPWSAQIAAEVAATISKNVWASLGQAACASSDACGGNATQGGDWECELLNSFAPPYPVSSVSV